MHFIGGVWISTGKAQHSLHVKNGDQILQGTLRLSTEDSKVCEISKLTLGLYFEIF